jgi:diguanylate cyclase (GGDEF)-like protein
MDFGKVRKDFTIYVVDSETSYCDLVSESLRGAGYHVESFMKGEDVIAQVKTHPPHIIVFGTYLMGMTGIQLIKQVRELSPDIQMVITANYAEGEIASEALTLGASDRIFKPIQNINDIVFSIDRVAERKFLEFSNEALYTKLISSKAAQRRLRRRFLAERTLHDFPKKFSQQLKSCIDGSQGLTALVESLSRELTTDVLFFRYIPVQNHFVCTHVTSNLEEKLKGIQLNLSFESLENDYEGARDILTVLLSTNHFDYRIVSASGKALGLLVIAKSLVDPTVRASLEHSLQVFEIFYELYETRKILYENLIRDELTGAWTRSEFERRSVDEISRARRLKMAVSMLYIGIDKAETIKSTIKQEAFELLIKKLASLLQRTSRVTDIIGRYGESELAVLLPHTDKLGAAIKAEKFRRLVERSDLAVNSDIAIRVSIGVSEYPSLCMDAETLWNAADSAYFQIKRVGNKVCLAAAPKGLEPDFVVKTT